MVTEKNINKERNRVINIVLSSLVLMFVLGIFAEFGVRGRLITWTDPVLTFKNIVQSLPLFNAGILAFIVIIVLDVILAMAFFNLFQSAGKVLVVFMAVFRLLYVAIKGLALVGLLLARDVYALPHQTLAAVEEATALQAMQFLKMHHYGFAVALIFFGLHLLLLGGIFLKIGQAPKWIARMVMIAGVGYIANSTLTLFVMEAALFKTMVIAVFILPMSFAELLLGWHLFANRNRTALLPTHQQSAFIGKPLSNPA